MANLTSIISRVASLIPFESKLTSDYVAENIKITWDGIPFEAYKDVFINVSFDTNGITTRQGIDGNVAYTGLPSPLLTISLSLEAKSPTNPFLWQVANDQHNTQTPYIGSLIIKDVSSGQMLTGISTVLQTPSSLSFGKQHTDVERTWVFKAAKAKIGSDIY